MTTPATALIAANASAGVTTRCVGRTQAPDFDFGDATLAELIFENPPSGRGVLDREVSGEFVAVPQHQSRNVPSRVEQDDVDVDSEFVWRKQKIAIEAGRECWATVAAGEVDKVTLVI